MEGGAPSPPWIPARSAALSDGSGFTANHGRHGGRRPSLKAENHFEAAGNDFEQPRNDLIVVENDFEQARNHFMVTGNDFEQAENPFEGPRKNFPHKKNPEAGWSFGIWRVSLVFSGLLCQSISFRKDP
jgi:hypothetical protein